MAQQRPLKTGIVTSTVNYDCLGPNEMYPAATAGLYRSRPFDVKQVHVHDMRGRESEFSLDKQGFEHHKHNIAFDAFDDTARTQAEYWPAVAEFLKDSVGAKEVIPFSHNFRKHTYEAVEAEAKAAKSDNQYIAGMHPARWVHIDQSPNGANILGDNIFKDKWPTMSTGRWAIINVWHPVSSVVRKDPLGLIDRTTLDKADCVFQELKAPANPRPDAATTASHSIRHETCAIKENPDHRWYWCSGLTREEVLFIRIYDSHDDGGVHGAPHTSFVIPGTEEEEKRQSVETRCFVFW